MEISQKFVAFSEYMNFTKNESLGKQDLFSNNFSFFQLFKLFFFPYRNCVAEKRNMLTKISGNDIGLGSFCFDFRSTNVVQFSVSSKVA